MEFKNIQKHDKLKNEFCETNGIKLLRIKYTDYNKIEEILDVDGVLKLNPKANEYTRNTL